MITKQEELAPCKVKVSFSYNKERVSEAITKAAEEFNKIRKFPGFRQGKAPVDAVKVFAKKPLLNYVESRLSQEALDDVLYETKWKTLIQPVVEKVKTTFDSFDIEMVICHKLAFDLIQYKEIELEDVEDLPSEEFVRERIINELIEKQSTFRPFTEGEFILDGDQCIFNFNAKIEDVKDGESESFEGDTGSAVTVVLGKTKIVPGFSDAVCGMMPGEQRTFSLLIPDDWTVKTIAGKKVQFVVDLLSAARVERMTYGEELAKSLKFESFDMLQAYVAKNASSWKEETTFTHFRNQMVKKIVEINKDQFTIPEWLIQDNAKGLAKMQGLTWFELNEQIRDSIITISEANIRFNLIVDKIKDLEPETVLSEEECYRVLNANMGKLPESLQQKLAEGKDLMLLSKALSDVQTENVLHWLVKAAKIIAPQQVAPQSDVAQAAAQPDATQPTAPQPALSQVVESQQEKAADAEAV